MPPASHNPNPSTAPRLAALPALDVTASVEVPLPLLEAIAARVAELLRENGAATQTPWLDLDGACSYLGLSRNSLYKLTAARAIPCRRKADGQGLRFHRHELDRWMESHYPRLDPLPD